ncbi:MAG TPA: HEAT repeat domain-containing protein [Pseudoduganella sp.]
MNKLRFSAACAGVFLILSQPMLAAAIPPPVELPCEIPSALEKLKGAPVDSRPNLIAEVLRAHASGKCVGQWLFPDAESARDLPVLIKLMHTDDEVQVRSQAAHALGWVAVDRKLIMDALRENLGAEKSAQVVLARIGSINKQLDNNYYDKWDESIRLDDLLNSLAGAGYYSSRTASENEAIREAVGYVVNKLIGAPYARPGKLDTYHAAHITERIANQVLGFMDVTPKDAPPISPWRADVLASLTNGLHQGFVVFEPKVHVPMMLSVAKRVDDPLPQVRKASLRLIVQVFDLLERQADKSWQDFDPYLSSWQVEQLVQKAAVALRDKDARTREVALALLGQLTQRSGSQDAALVAALNDPSIGVRKEAALALARKSSMPRNAVPRLVELARQEDEDSPHAIAGLSQVGSPAAMDVLIDILLAAADAEVHAKNESPPMPPPSWDWVPPERWLSPRALAKERTEAAARALNKYGTRVMLPILKRTAEARTTNARARLYSALVDAGWPFAAPDMKASEAALAPAILGEDEDSRVFALSLLAAQPVSGAHRYSKALVDAMFKRYLQDIPRNMSQEEANPSTIMMWGQNPPPQHWNTGWRKKPELAASIIAGGSDSKFAAERMVAFICAELRLVLREKGDLIGYWGGSPLSDEMDAADAMRASLESMGEVAKPYVQRALAKKSATLLCRATLDKNFVPPTDDAEPAT